MDNTGQVAQLQVPSDPLVKHRNQIQGEDKDAEFLTLRLVNKRGRVRLSNVPIDYSRIPGKSSLLAVGNRKGLLAAAVCKEDGHYLLLSTLSDLRQAIETGQPDPEPYIPFIPRLPLLKVPGTPIIIKFACNDERLLVGYLEGPISIYNTSDLLNAQCLDTIHTLPGDASAVPRDISPNPKENPELVAILRGVHGQEPGHQVDIWDVARFKHVAGWRKGDDPNISPVSISWSPKGKQIAIGLQSGDLLLYNPQAPGYPNLHFPKAPSIPLNASSLLAITWLANPTFHTVFSSPEASSSLFDPSTSSSLTKTHVISTHDIKSQSSVDVELQDPSPPFGAQFPPGPLSIVLRNWSPTKYIIICGDGPSPDIGVVGSLPSSIGDEDAWVNFTLEETSTPSLPLGEDTCDMALLGLELDLTCSKPVRMSEQPDDDIPDLPPSPILYAYMSDSTIVAWHILNTTGSVYPGMIANVETKASSLTPSSIIAPAITPAKGFGVFGSPDSTSAFRSPGFGFAESSTPGAFVTPIAPSASSSAFPSVDTQKSQSSPTFGSTGFGLKPVAPIFGAPGFGSKPAAPSFGQSGFGTFPAALPKSAPLSFSGGFAAFANQGTSTFGNTTSSSPPPPEPKPAQSGFATFEGQGTSPFGTSSSSPESKPTMTSMFGQSAFGEPASPPVPQSAFGTGGLGQAGTSPLSAFGVGGAGAATSFGQPQSNQATAAFGNFGTTNAVPAFGQTGFRSAIIPTASSSGAFGGLGALTDSLKISSPSDPEKFDSPNGSPPSPNGSLPDSPELRPNSQLMKPTSSYLKPAEGFGTFIKPSGAFEAPTESSKSASSVIKPAVGFDSPQLKPVVSAFDQTKPASPAFGTTGFGLPLSTPGSIPASTFGSTSTLGMNKPVFGTSTFGAIPKSTIAEPSKPITGGFGAFSSVGGGFASFASAAKSATFDDILSADSQDKKGRAETPLAFGEASSTKPWGALAFGAPFVSKTSSTPMAEESTKEPAIQNVDIENSADLGKNNDVSKTPKDTLQDQGSSGGLNTNRASSPLSLGGATPEVEPSTKSPSPVQPPVGNSEAADADTLEDAEDTPSEAFSFTDEGHDDAVSQSAEESSRSPTRSPSLVESDEAVNIPLPETPTPRPSPTPSTPPTHAPAKLLVFDLSSPSPTSSPISPAIDDSTTPPGSPEKSTLPIFAPLASKPVVPPSTASPFGLGLGRPSSRPIRSSPLASAPITSTDDNDSVPDVVTSKSAPTNVGQPFSPGQISSTEPRPSPEGKPFTSATLRPKTPPLLSVSSTPGSQSAPLKGSSAPGQPQGLPVPLTMAPARVPPQVATPTLVASSSGQVKKEKLEDPPQHPLQIEFQRAYEEMMKELFLLLKKAQEMALIRPVISEPRGLDKLVQAEQDFIPGQYSHGDLKFFTTMIGTLHKKVVPLFEQGTAGKSLLQDLQNLSLISETKQEELFRWVRAREDPEFAKTLKPRSLGPEHSEIQIRLRKALQCANDRTQQCEDQMNSLKKRLEQHKSGKLGIRPPSLDTIDRTCRNIQLVLEERTKVLEQLNDRINGLSPQTTQRLQFSHNFTGTQSPIVTPPFASVAAAALNSERSSFKLKTALLSARGQPLFTTNIAQFATTKTTPALTRPPWQTQRPTLNPDHLSPSHINRRSRPEKRHGAPQFKGGTPSGDVKPITFDWGPLPEVMPKRPLDAHSGKREAFVPLTK
ncbi:hypothetical protein K439DRAFT_543610 [Ramaria rubella]|nr:hypothetical protein K439DRAFT_543610 [Ramaria rubella]